MYDIIFTFTSLTAAQKARYSCSQYNISAKIIRLPNTISLHGCGFALQISSSEAKQAALILKLEKIPYQYAYQVNGDHFQEALF